MNNTYCAFLKWLTFLLLCVSICSEGIAEPELEWIRNLTGDWEGTFEWSGARTGSGKMTATYSITGNGSAVIENLMIESKTVMTSVYHMDGKDLRMTHYCAANNQPRLKVVSIDRSERRIKFELVDITNLVTPESGHVHKFDIHIKSEKEITLLFTFLTKGQESYERIELTRIRCTK
jgi:hypothetical protein